MSEEQLRYYCKLSYAVESLVSTIPNRIKPLYYAYLECKDITNYANLYNIDTSRIIEVLQDTCEIQSKILNEVLYEQDTYGDYRKDLIKDILSVKDPTVLEEQYDIDILALKILKNALPSQ